jgi:hypothetical protein
MWWKIGWESITSSSSIKDFEVRIDEKLLIHIHVNIWIAGPVLDPKIA